MTGTCYYYYYHFIVIIIIIIIMIIIIVSIPMTTRGADHKGPCGGSAVGSRSAIGGGSTVAIAAAFLRILAAALQTGVPRSLGSGGPPRRLMNNLGDVQIIQGSLSHPSLSSPVNSLYKD